MSIRKFAYLTAVVVTGAASAAGCASAVTTPLAANSASAARAHAGTTNLIAYSVNSDGPDFRAIATGAVGDYGPGVTVYPNGTIDPGHTSQLELRLSHGSFRLSISVIDRKIVRAYSHWPHNPATCSGSITVTAPAPVVAGTGTGAYRGITGRFMLKVTIDEVDAKPACNGTGKFLSQLILMAGVGTVSYR